MKKAYFAGGCFWCISSAFLERKGIIKVVSGYSGGDEVNPTYEEVKSQKTGHRETIEIHYDENETNFETLIDLFLVGIDPYDGEGQFIDRGHSYTTAIYYTSLEEKNIAEIKLQKLQEKSDKEVKVKIEKFKSFYVAEDYHQEFSLRHKKEFEKEMIESGRRR